MEAVGPRRPLPEQRRGRAVMRPALLLAALLTLPAAARAKPADWPMVRGDLAGTAFTTIRTADGDRPEAWQFQAGSHVWGYQPGTTVWTSPAVGRVKGRAVVLAGSYDRNVYCLDALTGDKLWRYATGAGIFSAPILWHHDGETTAFVPSSDRMLYALDADLGRRLWVHTVETWRPTIGGARLSSPCVGRARGRDAVFVGHWVWDKSLSGHMQAGGMTALDARSGEQLWTTLLGDNQVSSPIYAVTSAGPRLYVASENGNTYALNPDSGEQLWSFTDRDATKASPVYFRGAGGERIVIGSKYGRLRCLDALTGREVWRFKTGHWIDGSAAVARLAGKLTVLVGSYDLRLYALDAATGSPRWSYPTGGGVFSSPAVVQLDGGRRTQVLVASWDHHLHCVEGVDGSLLWSAYLGRPIWDSITLGDSIWSSPAVARINGRDVAYIGSYAGPLYAIPLDEAARKALARPGSNLDFWITLPVVLVAVALLTLFLTRRHRRPGAGAG